MIMKMKCYRQKKMNKTSYRIYTQKYSKHERMYHYWYHSKNETALRYEKKNMKFLQMSTKNI